ncbi:MAG: hypothetical protein K2H30_05750 [Clostridia bacterium]|nr:hypothetical protein [Clostridia bacterium]
MDEKTVTKLKKGEAVGLVATIFCAAVIAYFIICYTVAKTQNIYSLELTALISAPVLIVIGAAVGAFCNIKYGGAIEKLINGYVRDVCIENAALFHPERNSLSFYLNVDDTAINLQVNGYKEKIAFDFSVFGKLSLSKKITALTAIENRLSATFCKLWERGAKYTEVCFAEREGTRRKSGKTVYIIKDGKPDTKAYKQYLKNK